MKRALAVLAAAAAAVAGLSTVPASAAAGDPIHAAPYVDMGAWPTPSLTDMASASGLKSFTLAFVTASGCKAMWFNAYDPRQAWAKDQIDAIRAGGGDVKISFGGASGIELAQACSDVGALTAEYKAVVDAYGLKLHRPRRRGRGRGRPGVHRAPVAGARTAAAAGAGPEDLAHAAGAARRASPRTG